MFNTFCAYHKTDFYQFQKHPACYAVDIKKYLGSNECDTFYAKSYAKNIEPKTNVRENTYKEPENI